MSIFISIASYRDTIISNTIESLFTNANNPTRLFVGVLLQISNNKDEDIANTLKKKYNKNMKILTIDYNKAEGPLTARQEIIKRLYSNEDFYLQIDSHTRFYPDWDVKLLDNLFMLPNVDRSIISCYPISYDTYQKETLVPQMVKEVEYFKNKNIKLYKGFLFKSALVPIETPFLGAGFLFGTSEILKFYPMKRFPYLFQGEEMLLCLTFKKQGFKIYSPTENLIAHLYYRKNHPKIWEDNGEWNKKELIALGMLEHHLRLNSLI